MDTFYRFHWADCPEFSEDNAWSALWGAVRSADGSRTECPVCDGGGGECCGGCDDGWLDALPGYSSCRDAEELREYFANPARGEPGDDEGEVIVFTGRQVGTGFDGEPTAVPDRVLERMPWSALTTRKESR